MILFNEIALKIENILNGTDTETQSLVRPNDYLFKVKTSGFFLDHIVDKKEGKNFIPVFITSNGGEYDPVPSVKRVSSNYSITIYFPVRFKDDFFAMNDFLVECFVGKYLNYGVNSGSCLSNIGQPEYGEIQDIDAAQFGKWVENKYQERVDTMEKWMSMTFRLFLTSAASGMIFGNLVGCSLKFDVIDYVQTRYIETTLFHVRSFYNPSKNVEYEGEIGPEGTRYAWCDYDNRDVVNFYTDTLDLIAETQLYTFDGEEWWYSSDEIESFGTIEEPIENTFSQDLAWTSAGTGTSNSPIAQQTIDSEDSFATNIINITNNQKSFVAYYQNTPFWNKLLDLYNLNQINKISGLKFTKTYKIGDTTKSYEYDQVMLTVNENLALGQLLSFTFSLGDAKGE